MNTFHRFLPGYILAIVLLGVIAAGPTTAPTTAPATQPQAVNDMCPVETSHPVDDRETIVYKGHVIGFCCEDCKADFKKNPDKYLDNLNLK